MELINAYGWDYGRGMTNIDHKTGIRFGVIPVHDVSDFWYDESVPVYPGFICPDCGHEHKKEAPARCYKCRKEFNDWDFDCQEPIGFRYIKDGIRAFQSADSPDIFIEKSPVFTYAAFCSPCAPGACYIRDFITIEKPPENRCYCFPVDFHNEKPGHRIFNVIRGRK
jgi:predicted RNA-binding Zn-ribbon protein involved in translation (DUF1610 family)